MDKIKSIMDKIKENKIIKTLGPFTVLFSIVIIALLTTPSFGTAANITTVTLAAAVYVILAMGMTFIIIGGGIDLSLGSIVGLSGALCIIAMVELQFPLWAGALTGVAVGLLCGALNGFMVTKMGLIPFIATLGGQWIYRGIFNLLSNGTTISIRGMVSEPVLENFIFLGGGRILGIPLPTYIFIVLALILSFILRHTVFGRNVYSVGSNKEAAKMSGINNDIVKLKTHMLGGALAGLSGVLLAARMVSMPTNAGTGYEFEGIFATVVGGTSMSGGDGSIMGAVIGAFIVAILRNVLNLNGINTFWQQVILGIIIVIAVYIDTLRTRKNRNAV